MLGFSLIALGDYKFRCVLGHDLFFDFSIGQFCLFGYEHFCSFISDAEGASVYEAETGMCLGDVASVRYVPSTNEVWILIRNGIRGELYKKVLNT